MRQGHEPDRQVPCAGDPAGWDLDMGTLTQWLAALRTCADCPVLRRCGQLRDAHYPRGSAVRRAAGNPRSVIWAAVAYSEDGSPMSIDTLRGYARRQRRIELPESVPEARGTGLA